MRHCSPGVVSRRRLRVPDIARVPGELSGLERPNDGVTVHDRPTRGVHDVGPVSHRSEQPVAEELIGLGHKGAVDRQHVDVPDEGLHVGVVASR